jgi:TPR repeat protein
MASSKGSSLPYADALAAAETHGDASAALLLGCALGGAWDDQSGMLATGRHGLELDISAAHRFLAQAAKSCDTSISGDALYQDALLCTRQKDYDTAEKLLRAAIARGHAEAAVRLAALLIQSGEDTSTEADTLLRIAARAGHTGAAGLLGARILATDPDAATRLLRFASLGGYAAADYDLYTMYKSGSTEAAMRLRRAAVGGHPEAQLALAAALAVDGKCSDAAKLLRRAAEGSKTPSAAIAAMRLGIAYAAGAGVTPNAPRALYWLQAALAAASLSADDAAAAAREMDRLLRCSECAAATGLHACKWCQATFLCGATDCQTGHQCEGQGGAESSEESPAALQSHSHSATSDASSASDSATRHSVHW